MNLVFVRYDEVTDRTLGAREALARAEERRVAAEATVASLRSENEALGTQLRLKTHEADLLGQDKLYLTKEVEALGARLRQAQATADRAVS